MPFKGKVVSTARKASLAARRKLSKKSKGIKKKKKVPYFDFIGRKGVGPGPKVGPSRKAMAIGGGVAGGIAAGVGGGYALGKSSKKKKKAPGKRKTGLRPAMPSKVY